MKSYMLAGSCILSVIAAPIEAQQTEAPSLVTEGQLEFSIDSSRRPSPPVIYENLPPEILDNSGRPNLFRQQFDSDLRHEPVAENAQGIVEIATATLRPDAVANAWAPIGYLWEPGANLRVCFLNGPVEAHREVVAFAEAWNGLGANISLDFGAADYPRTCNNFNGSEIRVAFNASGDNWSRIGRTALTHTPGAGQATMQLDIHTVFSQAGAGMVRHEFGHALGLNHEHQRPHPYGCEDEIDWDLAFQFFYSHQGWSQHQTLSQLGPRDTGMGSVHSSDFDPTSIMMYAMPPMLFKGGSDSRCFVPTPASELSQGDIDVLTFAYSEDVWDGREEILRGFAGQALNRGDEAEAREIGLSALPLQTLRNIAIDDMRDAAFGAATGPGPRAKEKLESALQEFIEGSRR